MSATTATKLKRALRQNFQGVPETPPRTPPRRIETAQSMPPPSAALKDMNFKVEEKFHREFKIEATRRGMRMNEFLKHIYQSFMQSESGRR